jgi:hypothetical protein
MPTRLSSSTATACWSNPPTGRLLDAVVDAFAAVGVDIDISEHMLEVVGMFTDCSCMFDDSPPERGGIVSG